MTTTTTTTTTTTNLGQHWTSSLTKMVDLAKHSAQQSTLALRHGAVLFSSKNKIYCTGYNQLGQHICGFDVPSLHAEAVCLQHLIGHRHLNHRYRGA